MLQKSVCLATVLLAVGACSTPCAGQTSGPEPAPREAGFTDADYSQHVNALRGRLPAGDFTVIIEPPFVVIGDESPPIVSNRAVKTVRWATSKLKASYFKKDPDAIIDIWLFKDTVSYEKHAKALFGNHPGTPFGFSLPDKNALVMNIATGGGTLVHEMVHPFMRSNFPDCPAWFNEGLASLYEQSSERDGQIVGLTNWRLEGLQRSIRRGDLPSFARLTRVGDQEFYGEDRGSNYAQSRYLCYYLQEKGLLKQFYGEFAANSGKDPSGYDTLRRVLPVTDMADFEKRWQAFVMGLHFE